MSDVQRLICSIIKFLRSQLGGYHQLTPDACESLEVAIQCLESAYNVSQDDPTLEVSTSLLEMFKSSLSLEPVISDKDASEEDKEEAERLKSAGNEFMKTQQFAEALDHYTRAIALDGRNAVYYCNRGAAYLKLDNIAASIQDCKAALKIDPNYGKAYGRLGLAHTSAGDHEAARAAYERAVQLDPENDGFRNNLRLTEERLSAPSAASAASAGPTIPGLPAGLDLGSLLNNPALMNMAAQMMQYPGMQTMLNSFVAGGGPATPAAGGGGSGGGGMEALLQAGSQLAQQMSSSNPELIEELRRQMGGPGNTPGAGDPGADI